MNLRHRLPAEIYAFVEQTPGTMLLESSRPGSSSVSRVFTAPIEFITVDTPDALPALFSRIEDAIRDGYFAAGYLAYECGQYFEPKTHLRTGAGAPPLARFGIYDRCFPFDHREGIFLEPFVPGTGSRPGSFDPVPARELAVDFALDPDQFQDRIAEIHRLIRAGDIYQLNFTFPLTARVEESPRDLYARLSAAQPVDYAAFLHFDTGRYVLCFSPELFFRIDNDGSVRRITTRPMKGTARRGRTTAEDLRISQWLHDDPKNRAENVMIVDLIRNDLGRLCTYGTVRVEELFAVERYPTLWQMTSTVSGELRPEVGCEQVLRALFPSGSITGAPKVRAMQLISAIETGPRGIYTGAIGYFSARESVFNVAIRTVSLEDGNLSMGVGSGIVIDSDAAAEFEECRLKAEFLTRSSESFSLIETLLWKGEYPFLEMHLDRLRDSASFFDFPCDCGRIRALLLHEAADFDSQARRVRLLLDSGGRVQIETSPLASREDSSRPARVLIARQRTDPRDTFLFHKTTRRPIYDAAFRLAAAAGFEDVLFFNMRGELTEGAISNLFVAHGDAWYTPPLSSGLLAGVYRRHLMSTRPGIEEKILFLEDLKAADGVYLANAVRGLRRVTIDWDA